MFLVNQTFKSELCSVTIYDSGKKNFYAYYIYNNKKCIEKIMYSSNKTIEIKTSEMEGVLQVKVFLKNRKTREVVSKSLKPIQLGSSENKLSEPDLDNNVDFLRHNNLLNDTYICFI